MTGSPAVIVLALGTKSEPSAAAREKTHIRENPAPEPRQTPLSLDDGQATWDLRSERIERLIALWETAAGSPSFAELVPAGPAALRRLVLTELIKVDLDYRWTRGEPRRIEDYLADFPDLAGPSGVPSDLIFEEFQVRKRSGDAVDPEEYAKRFPHQASDVAPLPGDPPARIPGGQHLSKLT